MKRILSILVGIVICLQLYGQTTLSSSAQTVCAGANVSVTANNATPNVTYSWTAAGQASVSGALLTLNAVSQSITWTCTTYDASGIPIDSDAFNLTVNALPVISGNTNLCVGLTSQLTGSGIANANNPWVSSNTNVATVTANGLVTGISGGNVNITYTNNNGCQENVLITVYSIPTISGNTSLCVGLTSQLTGSGTSNANNPWVSSNTNVASVTANGLVTGISGGNANITYTNNNGCQVNALITVYSNPTISPGNTTLCVGLTYQLTGSGTANANNPWVSNTPSVATVTANGLVTGISVGTALITYTNINGCQVNAFIYVISNPTISSGNTTLCVGSTSQLTGSGTANANNPWVSSNTNVATVSVNGLVTGVSAGTANITYTNINGCQVNSIVTVNPIPSITNNLLSQTICSGANTSAVNWTSNVVGTTYSWTASAPLAIIGYTNSGSGNMPSTNTIQNTGAVSGSITYSVTPSANGCVGSSIQYTIIVNPIPILTLSQNQSICGGVSTSVSAFVNSVAGGSFNYSLLNQGSVPGSVTGYPINGIGQIPASVIYNGGSNPYTLSYSVVPTASGCNGVSGTYQITINPSAVTTFSPQANQTICSGQNTTLVNLSSTTQNVIISWSLPNGVPAGISNLNPTSGTGSIPVFTNLTNNTANPITITFTAQASNGPNVCPGSLATYSITVNPLPIYTPPQYVNACSGTAVGFQLSANMQSTYSWYADTNLNVTGESMSLQNSSIINNTLTLTSPLSTDTVLYFITPTSVGGGCIGSLQQLSVIVHPIPSMTSANNTTVCSGTALNFPLTSNLPCTYSWVATNNGIVTGESTNPAVSSAISDILSHSTNINQNVTYNITPISVAGSCNGPTQTFTVTVKPLPTVTSPATGSICSGNTLNITITSSIPSNFSWIATSNPNVTGENTITQNTSLINDQLSQNSTVNQTVVYTITPTSTVGGCQGNPQSLSITVYPKPLITSPNTISICSGTALNFPLSANVPSSFVWLAADNTNVSGESLISQNSALINNTLTQSTLIPQVVTYTITPTSTGGGCIGNSQQLSVTVNPLPIITSSNSTSVCSGTPLNINLTSSIPSGFSWVAMNNPNVTGESLMAVSSTTIDNTLVHNSTANQQTVTYTITPTSNAGGCVGVQQTLTVTVNALPDSTISTNGPTVFCSGGNVELSVPQVNNTTYSWSLNGTAIPGGVGSIYFANQTGIYAVTIVNQYGCSSNDSMAVSSLTNPTAFISNSSPSSFFCQGSQVTLNSNSNCIGCNLSYQWLNNSLNPIAGANSATYSFTVNATSNYYLVTSNNLNGVSCMDTSTSLLITMISYVLPTFSLPDSICINNTYSLPQLSNNLISGNWNHPSITGQNTTYIFSPLVGQCALPFSWNVDIVQLPIPNLGNDTTICSGDPLSLSLSGYSSYLWSNGSNNSSIQVNPMSTELFSVSVTNNFGCVGFDSLSVTVNPNPATPVIVGPESVCLNSLNQIYSSSPTSNWLIWNIDGANIYSGQYTNNVHLDFTATDTVWLELTEHVLSTGCFATGSLMVLVDTNAAAPAYVNVLPLGNQNDMLSAPQATNVFRWGKINKFTNDIFLEPSVLIYHNFTLLDTATYYYFVDHGAEGCFTRSFYNYPELITGIEESNDFSFWLAPNPVISEFNIMSESMKLVEIQVENIEGKCVYSGLNWTNTPINCAHFNPGIYFVKIHNGINSHIVKFLKL